MRTKLQLNDWINTFDLEAALQGEYGTFQVTTPGGEDLLISLKPGDIMPDIRCVGTGNKRPFLVTKISEPVTREQHAPLRAVAAG